MAGSEFYDHTTYPSNGASGSSSAMRSTLDAIEAGFDKLAGMSGNGLKIVGINSGGTAYEAVTVTGTGNVVRATSPTLITPVLGVATITSLNKVTITAPANSAVLTIADGKTLTASNTLTFTGTDASSIAFGTGGTIGLVGYSAAAPTNGNVLTGNGSAWESVAPVVASAATGSSMALLATLTPTAAANIDALSVFSATYDNYLICADGITFASDDGINLRFASAGSADAGTNYAYNAVNTGSSAGGLTSIAITSAATVRSGGKGCNFEISILNVNDATRPKYVSIIASWNDTASSTAYSQSHIAGSYYAANISSGIRLFSILGNNFAATGTIRIYGFKNA